MSRERFFYVTKDGKIIHQEENDGPAFLRKGAQTSEVEISLYQLMAYGADRTIKCLEHLRDSGFVIRIEKGSEQ